MRRVLEERSTDGRQPAHRVQEGQGRPQPGTEFCAVCHSTAEITVLERVQDYVTQEWFSVLRCRGCELVRTHPQPAFLDSYYPARYRRYSGLTRVMLRRLYRWRVHRWVGRPQLPAAALEIGCGPGWMLQALRERGWRVIGTERTIESATAAIVNGLPVFVGDLDALRPTSRFDVIILFHVLEHLADPLDTLRDCATLLTMEGRLILSVPNFHSWQAWLFGPHWFHLDIPRHQYHFEPRSLAQTLRHAGFEVLDMSFVSFEHDVYGWIQSFLNAFGFEQNLLTKLLMGYGSGKCAAGVVVAMAGVSVVLVVPSLLLSLCSWLTRSGAIMEVRAVKTGSERIA